MKILILIVVASLVSSATLVRAVTVRVEVIASFQELTDYFGAAASYEGGKLEFSLHPSLRWAAYGTFRSYTLMILPIEVSPTNVEKEHWHSGSESIVSNSDRAQDSFKINKDRVSYAYIVAHFGGGKAQGADRVEVLIPASVIRELANKKPNQAPEPTRGTGSFPLFQSRRPRAAHL